MFNPFPELFAYQLLAFTFLRVAAGLVFVYAAWTHFKRRDDIAHVRFPLIGAGAWVAWFGIIVELAVAAALIAGYDTQWAAIVGALIALKYATWAGRYPAYFMLPRSTALLLFAICIVLLFTGAGFFAFDIPL